MIAQLSLSVISLPFLPPFEAWYSGALPYPWLLASQFILIVLMAMVAWRFSRGTVMARKGWGQMLLGLGLVYFAVMLIRLVVGITGISDIVWFNRPIPSFFHLVLASYVILVGHFHITLAQTRNEQE